MKDEWYGDKRDLVKWAVLLHLANEYSVQRVVQVAYLRHNKWKSIFIDEKKKDIPPEVLIHFRCTNNIINLASNPEIIFINSIMKTRSSYLKVVLGEVNKYKDKRNVIFLDPDTGLEPGRPTLKHVLVSELEEIWKTMQGGDLLVFYQHKTNRNKKPWIEEKRKQFAGALGVPISDVKKAQSPESASDVVFFYCQKDDSSANKGAA